MPDEPVTRQLSLVRQKQDGPYHWSLFVAYENKPGLVLQVRQLPPRTALKLTTGAGDGRQHVHDVQDEGQL